MSAERGPVDASNTLAAAQQRHLAGDHAEALRVLDTIEGTSRASHLRRAAALQRAIITFHQGDLAAAEAHAQRAAEGKTALLSRLQERWIVTEARAMLVLLRALRDAPEDAVMERAVRDDDEAGVGALAQVALARLVRIERAGDHAALEGAVAEHRELLLAGLSRAERARFRAIERGLIRDAPSAYRRLAVPREPLGQVARVEVAPTGATEPGVSEIASRNTTNPWQIARVVALWLMLVVMFLVCWKVADRAPQPTSTRSNPGFAFAFAMMIAVGAVLLVAQHLYTGNTERRLRVRLTGAERDLAMGFAIDTEELSDLRASNAPLVAAQAARILARAARRDGDLQTAEAETRAAIAKVASTQEAHAIAARAFLPTLLGERAEALAALGREEEARAELALLERSSPVTAVEVARHAVATVLAGRAGDLTKLSELEHAGRAFPRLDHRIELLGVLGRAAVDPESVGLAEIARVEKELAQDEGLRAWIDAINPRLATALGPGDAVAEEEAASEEDDDAGRRPGVA